MSTIIEYPELKETQGKIDERQTKLATIFAEAGPEFDMAKVKSLDGDSAAKVAAVGALNAELADLTKARDAQLVLLKGAQLAADESLKGEHQELGTPGRAPGRKSMGQLFAESPVRTGGLGTKAELNVELKTLMSRSAGWATESLRDPGYLAAASAPVMFWSNSITPPGP